MSGEIKGAVATIAPRPDEKRVFPLPGSREDHLWLALIILLTICSVKRNLTYRKGKESGILATSEAKIQKLLTMNRRKFTRQDYKTMQRHLSAGDVRALQDFLGTKKQHNNEVV